jgi:hypothetical protein
MRSVTSKLESPFTLAQQRQKHQGQRWEFTAGLPNMLRADAEEWIAFFGALNVGQGTFLFGDPNGETARGAATGTPLVDGASQTGDLLVTKGWTINITGILKLGDYISLGTGTSTRLHKLIEADVNSDGSGDATLRVWPDIRESPADNDAITVSACKGTFVLATSQIPFNIKAPGIYQGLTFAGVEAL